jgi:hypothetical protein
MPFLIGALAGIVLVQVFIYFKQGRPGNQLHRYIAAHRHEIEQIDRWLMTPCGWLLYKLPDGRLLQISEGFVKVGNGSPQPGVRGLNVEVECWAGMFGVPWSNYKRIRRMLSQP